MQILVFICFVGAPEEPATDGGQDDAATALMNMSSPPCRRSRERVIKTHTHGKFVCSGCQLLSRTPPPPPITSCYTINNMQRNAINVKHIFQEFSGPWLQQTF